MNVMIDIETLSTECNAIILTIAGIKFDIYERIRKLKNIPVENKFYCRVNIESCEKLGLHKDKKTIDWWEDQSNEAKNEALYNSDRIDIELALGKLSLFLRGCENIWANSPNFDCVILENAYKTCKMCVPWKYWNLRDCRTVYKIADVSLKDIGETSHNSLEDCYNQIICLKVALKKLKIKKL